MSHLSEGEILVDDIPVYMLPSEKRADFRSSYIGFVFQSFHLIPYLTTMENVMLPMTIASHLNSRQKILAYGVLEKVGLAEKAVDFRTSFPAGNRNAWPSPVRW